MKQHVLITGASKGIGFALTKLFLEKGFAVTAASRRIQYADLQYSDFHSLALDLSDPSSIKRSVGEIKEKGIQFDILIHNAGVGPDLNAVKPDTTTYHETFAVNTEGTVFFKEAMLPFIKKGGKIINISSKMGSVALCTGTDSPAYRMSKAALNMYTRILAEKYRGTFLVAALHPGWVRTTLSPTNIHGRLSPEQSAQGIYEFVNSDFETDTFWNVETGDFCEW